MRCTRPVCNIIILSTAFAALTGRRCRHLARADDADRVHDLPHVLAALARNQLPGVPRLSAAAASQSIHGRDISVLQGEAVHGRRRKGRRACKYGRYASLAVPSFLPPPQCLTSPGRLLQGDVSLSAEDMATTRPFHPPIKHAAAAPQIEVPVDYEVDDLEEGDDEDEYYLDEEEDDHSNWLQGSTAAKFLAAGGVAGAGASSPDSDHGRRRSHIAHSLANVHSAIRPVEDLLDYTPARSRRDLTKPSGTGPRGQSHWRRHCANIRGGRRTSILDGQRPLRRQDTARVCHQVPIVRILSG